jgi:hypothetical protein
MYLPSFMLTRTPPSTYGKGISLIARAAAVPAIGERVGILFGVGREDHGDDLSFVEKALGKQRADRAIDQAAGEDFLFRGTSPRV